MNRLYDTWNEYEKRCFNPDGSMTESYWIKLCEAGWDLAVIMSFEVKKIDEVREYDRLEKYYQENFGKSYEEACSDVGDYHLDISERQRLALLAGDELSSLPEHVDPDDYYYSRCGSAIYGDDEDTWNISTEP